MNQISLDISRYTTPQTKAKSQRQEANEHFFNMIDKESEERGWKYFDGKKYKKLYPINRRLYSIKLNTAFKSIEELREFYSECMDYKHRHGSFSKRFKGGFKQQSWN
jgi:plasmid maintenance system killer protein